MRRATASLVCLTVIVWFTQINRAGSPPPPAQSAGASISQPTYKVKLQYDVRVPMRDGVKLSTDIYRPDAPGTFGVIVIRTPYDNNSEGSVRDAIDFATRGFAVVVQDCRGREDSEGEWIPFVHEDEDGYDTIEWAATQPWSNGKVGMYGGSYVGQTQWRPAGLAPPHLTAIFPVVAYSDFYHNWVYTGGAFQLAFNQRWQAIQMHTRTVQRQYLWIAPPNHLRDLYWHLPLITGDEAAGRVNATYKEWIRHPTYDDYWKALSMRNKYRNIDVAAYSWGGWFDVFLQGATDSFVGVTKQGKTERARKSQKMLIGPWIHSSSGRHIGDMDFGPAADIERKPVVVRWFDYWLKGIENGIMEEPPVKIFVMGENAWREESAWPLTRTQYTKYYLHSSGHANSFLGDGSLSPAAPGSSEPPDKYTYDPQHPAPTLGGATCCGESVTPVPMGPRDQRLAERRDDVLVYTSPVLTDDVEVIGPVQVKLYAASSAPDTDWTAKLVDVFPNGFAMNLADGIIRARYRESFEQPTLIEPGQLYEYTIDLWATANVFQKGHQIRVEISSSNFPHYDRNPNTGAEFGTTTELKVAQQTIYHDATRPSHIVLPVIPRKATSSGN